MIPWSEERKHIWRDDSSKLTQLSFLIAVLFLFLLFRLFFVVLNTTNMFQERSGRGFLTYGTGDPSSTMPQKLVGE